ncbi:hypothetical protein Slin14017_G056490 [Septoria linicola]|nr:hypothetical protein Slin14017_G056490 [Septoria linicola]
MYQRFSGFVFTAAIITGLLVVSFYATESDILRRIHLPSWTAITKHEPAPSTSQEIVLSTTRHIDAHEGNHSSSADATRPASSITTHLGLPPHHEQSIQSVTSSPKAVLVISTIEESDNSWINDELGELLRPDGDFSAKIYVNNNLTAPLHTPANKGHEAMTYLTYIIENYHELPPVSAFLHDHPEAWHNNILLDMSTSEMIGNLRLDKVEQDGYFNLRCHWNPGCPEHLYPFATEYDAYKSEELLIKTAWMQVFEVEEEQVPKVLGQACCSQFAVTADRIRSLPLEKYVHFRNWLLESKLTDYVSGRVFEYFWQYMLNGTPVFCPDPRICYCEGYGICFEKPEDYDSWFELGKQLRRLEDQLKSWNLWQDDKNVEKRQEFSEGIETGDLDLGEPKVGPQAHEAKAEEWMKLGASVSYYRKQKARIADPLYEPPAGRGAWLIREIDQIRKELGRRKQDAMNRGIDPAARSAAVEAVKGSAPPATEDGNHGGWQKKRDMYI